MEKLVINKLGPIEHCELEIKDFMVFTGPQASGKSTIAKSIFSLKISGIFCICRSANALLATVMWWSCLPKNVC